MPADGRSAIGAIVLAAGYGRRFGSDKRTYALHDGTPMLEATLRVYIEVFERIVVVLRPEDENLKSSSLALSEKIEIVTANQAHLGMGHSLARGIAAARSDKWEGAFIALADMPFVKSDTLRQLSGGLARADDTAIVQPVFEDRPGHPVGFKPGYFPRLGLLEGDEGARIVLDEAGDRVIRVAVDDPGILLDVDRPDKD